MRIFVKELRNRGLYEARLEGETERLVVSRMPLFASARALLKRGIDPNERLEMWREGKSSLDIGGIIGPLAKLTVEEGQRGGPTLRPLSGMGGPDNGELVGDEEA
jgi:hypothetical protein